jgi:hypothetical protein
MEKIEKILDRKVAADLTKDELDQVENFADDLTQEFIKFRSTHQDTGYGETDVKTWKIKFLQSFPVRLDYQGKSYYGLCRPPTGVITWQGPTARFTALKAGVPIKLPLINVGSQADPDFKVKRGAGAYGEFIARFQREDGDDFDFDDSQEAKQKVIEALERTGVNFDTENFEKKGALKGIETAINNMNISDMIEESLSFNEKELLENEGITKNVKFWKIITKIL